MSRRVLLIAAGACLAIVAGWYFLLWSPGTASLSDARDRRSAAERRELETRAKVQALTAAQKNMPAIQANLDALRRAVPDTPELDQIIATVNDAARQSGVDLQSLAPTPAPAVPAGTSSAAAASPFSEVRVTIAANGSYFQLVDFVHRLSNAPRLMMVDGYSISGQKDGRQSTGITGRMFVRNTAPAPAAPAPAAPAPTTAGAK